MKKNKKEDKEIKVIDNKDICPSCKSKLIRQEGCYHCPICGYGKCD
jgi:uncharacterized Zn finger protein (UPF0148 family)